MPNIVKKLGLDPGPNSPPTHLCLWYMYFYWAHLCICTVGSYASLSVCLSVCLWLDQNSDWTKSHQTKIDHSMYGHQIRHGDGHGRYLGHCRRSRSKVKVTDIKKVIFLGILHTVFSIFPDLASALLVLLYKYADVIRWMVMCHLMCYQVQLLNNWCRQTLFPREL